MASKITRLILIIVGSLLCAADGYGLSRAPVEGIRVRVAVVNNEKSVDLSIRGAYTIIDGETNGMIDKGKRLKRCSVSVDSSGILIGDKEYGIDRLRIVTNKDVALYQGGRNRRYRDQIDIIKTKKGELLIVNSLDLELYVKGVLYHEVPHRWPMNAIKAQAVATRTYALYQVQKNKDQEFDVRSDIYSQVYGGKSAERYRTNIAVNRTRGQILTYEGKVLPAYFHSNCGGQTENVAELWDHDLPPLKGVKCGYCRNLPSYRWKKNFRSKDIQEKLNAHGFKLGLIKEIVVLDRTKSGRIRTLEIRTRDGQKKKIPGIKFREIVGPNIIKSNLYDIEMKGYYFDLTGRGWGHGVGMCQWGSYQMAKMRFKYTSILEYYYPGAKITDISEL